MRLSVPTRAALLAVALAVYAGVYLAAADHRVAALGLVPVALAGGLFGLRAGAVFAIGFVGVQLGLVAALGDAGPGLDFALHNWAGFLVVLACGPAFGRLRDLALHLRAQADEIARQRDRVMELETARFHARLEAAERLTSLGTLAGGIAHEINNPLTLVLGNLSLLRIRMADAPPDVREALEEARIGAERVRDVVRGLYTWTGAGDPSAYAEVDVRRVVDEALALAGGPLEAVARVVREEEDVPPVLADAACLREALRHLLLNAAQAIPPGRAAEHEVRVSVRLDGGRVCVAVRDTGEGIPPSVRPRIFEPFFTTREVGAGAGLGLFTAQGIVSAAGGAIEVESEPGRGSTFRVLLPAVGAEVSAAI